MNQLSTVCNDLRKKEIESIIGDATKSFTDNILFVNGKDSGEVLHYKNKKVITEKYFTTLCGLIDPIQSLPLTQNQYQYIDS